MIRSSLIPIFAATLALPALFESARAQEAAGGAATLAPGSGEILNNEMREVADPAQASELSDDIENLVNDSLEGSSTDIVSSPELREAADLNSAASASTTPDAHAMAGLPVLDSEGRHVGEIRQVVTDPDGSVQTVVVDLGTLLGVEEKAVGFDSDAVTVERVDDGTALRVRIDASRSELEDMPEFSG